MTDITGGDVEIVARRMSAERLAVKRAHAAKRPGGRTAELMAHIAAQDEAIQRLYDKRDADNAQWNRLLAQHVDIESDLRDEVQAQRAALKEVRSKLEMLIIAAPTHETALRRAIDWLAAHKEE